MQKLEDMVCEWMFIDGHHDALLVDIVCDWKTALVEYVGQLFVGAKRNLFVQSFSGFENVENAIEFFNTVYRYSSDKIIAMIPITEQGYLDKKAFEWDEVDEDEDDDYE